MPAYFFVGRIAALSGKNLDRGEQSLRKYVAYTPKADEPGLAAAHYRLGGIHEKQGRRELAHNEYQAALRLLPRSKEVAEALKRVAK